MTELTELLWCHAVDNEDWTEAARLERLARGLGQPSIEAVPGTSADAPETLPSTERLD